MSINNSLGENNENERFGYFAVKVIKENQLRKKYTSILEEKYPEPRVISPVFSIMRIVFVAAAVMSMIIASLFLFKSHSNGESIVKEYIAKTNTLGNQILTRKDIEASEDLHIKANTAFANDSFDLAIEYYEEYLKAIEKTSELDLFYLGVSYLKQNMPNPQLAILNLELAAKNNELLAESNWYLALAYLLMRDKNRGIVLLNEIMKTKSYKYKEAEMLIKDLN
jgi:tetratricopeptide (TPR) repeat protein